jgi:hypothetical protein
MNIPEFFKDARFWTAIFDVVAIIVVTYRPELQDKLDQIVPLLVIITVAVFGGKIVDSVGNAYVRAQYAKAGRVLPEDLKKLA